jgi:NitT/TauT family transport system substrate-binding protein
VKRILPALIAVPLLLLAACNSGTTPQETTDDGLVKITVANLAVTPSASLVLGVEKGFFEAEGLDVTLKDTPAAATQAAVVSGEAQFAFTNVPAILAATANGLPIRVVGPAAKFPSDPADDFLKVVAPAGSPIKSPKDLEGRTVAVDTLYQLPHLSMIISARSLGVDTSKIKFLEVPFPAMADALANGQADAANLGEPFLSPELAKGGTPVMSNGAGFKPETVQTLWVTSAPYVAENPEIVEKFARALEKSNEYASANDDEVRQAVTTYTKTPVEASKKIFMPYFSAVMDRTNFQIYYDTMKELGVIKKDIDLDSLFVEPTG